MKKLVSQTWFAAALCVVVLFGTVLLNTRVKLGREVSKVNTLLLTGNEQSYSEALDGFLRRNDNGYTRLCANLAGVKFPVQLG